MYTGSAKRTPEGSPSRVQPEPESPLAGVTSPRGAPLVPWAELSLDSDGRPVALRCKDGTLAPVRLLRDGRIVFAPRWGSLRRIAAEQAGTRLVRSPRPDMGDDWHDGSGDCIAPRQALRDAMDGRKPGAWAKADEEAKKQDRQTRQTGRKRPKRR